ncbi:MAG: hypothetical protein QM682_05365 [Paracoccus sp. (in: a-proteobacteria)]|uniref:hypothetical protein n=1 Tax=Paracoccus sp. TaxID=267 RepID=UPI0039E23FB3
MAGEFRVSGEVWATIEPLLPANQPADDDLQQVQSLELEGALGAVNMRSIAGGQNSNIPERMDRSRA